MSIIAGKTRWLPALRTGIWGSIALELGSRENASCVQLASGVSLLPVRILVHLHPGSVPTLCPNSVGTPSRLGQPLSPRGIPKSSQVSVLMSHYGTHPRAGQLRHFCLSPTGAVSGRPQPVRVCHAGKYCYVRIENILKLQSYLVCFKYNLFFKQWE